MADPISYSKVPSDTSAKLPAGGANGMRWKPKGMGTVDGGHGDGGVQISLYIICTGIGTGFRTDVDSISGI